MIRVRVVCVFRRGDRILVSFALNPADGGRYARTLGGGVQPGERSADALRREIGEELGLELAEPRLLGVLENIFTLAGRLVHEVVFVYDAAFADPGVYERTELPVDEAACIEPARWVALDTFAAGAVSVYPKGIVELLVQSP
jgi:ADP-ribose pyrophosphatase YjhB (NUDIX family)